MSLKAKPHINTIGKVWVITPHGARQKFGIPIFVHEMTSAPPPDHLTPLPFLFSHMNWLCHTHPPLRFHSTSPYDFNAPSALSRYSFDTALSPPYTPPTQLAILMLLQHPEDVTLTPPPISTLTTTDASTPLLTILTLPQHPQDMPLTLPPHLWAHPS
ncbi:hypothetical protein O181_093218 [Austropuccinia psidii MF-1]|uniref:Uncharacterized protein n=1 Tax=Austropuccinia psidii MF-1 TaxID=1389203 RepID=A0A9Q3P950_9BASI|nr:hypothetical protein [Austropuccinia psidii MF-1]